MEVDPWEQQLVQGTSQREDETKFRGTLGLRIPLIANYYKPHHITPCTIIEYRVQLIHGAREQQECTVRKRCRRYFWRAVFDQAHRQIFLSQNQLVYDDHSALFSAEPLWNPDTRRPIIDDESFVLRYPYKEEAKTIPIMLTVQRTNSVYIGPPLSERALQFLTLLTTQAARRPVFDAELNFIPRAQTWFGENNRIYVLPYQGGPIWTITPATALLRGLRCAMKLDQNGLPIFNVSRKYACFGGHSLVHDLVVHSLFARANFSLIDVYAILRGEEPLTDEEREQMRNWSMNRFQALQLETELRGIDLRATYGPKLDYKLLSIDRGNPGERRFLTPEFGEVSVPEYYRRRYGITLRFASLPLFRMRPEEKNIYIPMELLTISGEIKRVVRKLQPSFIDRVLKATTMKPVEHFQAIENLAAHADVMTSTTENTFGVSFGPPEQIQMMRVNGRVLPYPDCLFTLNIKTMAGQPVPDATTKPVILGLVQVGSISRTTC
ncbi:ALG-5 protein, partial [Aphelenchoides avenae]